MRQLTSHKVNPANGQITIQVLDNPGSGGACHDYRMSLPGGEEWNLNFQNGPIAEAGVNGITHEALLAILVDRLQDFQVGPFACRENALALTKLQEAQMWLLERTRGRRERGVEGTHET
jgi:hypothetical protein